MRRGGEKEEDVFEEEPCGGDVPGEGGEVVEEVEEGVVEGLEHGGIVRMGRMGVESVSLGKVL